MRTLGTITDPTYATPAQHGTVDRFFLKLIRDERDLPFIHLSIKITASLLPLGVLLYMPFVQGGWWWLAAVAYQYLNNIVFKGPFGLMLHCTSHRPLFRKEYEFLNHYIPWVLAPFFGHSPETYFAHHIGMHHAENNLEDDDSSTMPYQRDSVRGFAHYFGRFLFAGIYNLAAYFWMKRRRRLLYRAVRGEILFIVFCAAMCWVNWPATLVVFIIPFVLFRLISMMGNWAQHAFLRPEDPANAYWNSITCINTKYNHKCWNDGYHISHHIKPSMHWTEHPIYFRKTLQQYIDRDAIVFDGIHFLHVFFWLMGKRYDLLAKHYVDLSGRYANDAEVMEMLRARTAPIPFQSQLAHA